MTGEQQTTSLAKGILGRFLNLKLLFAGRVDPRSVTLFLGHYSLMMDTGISQVEILDSLRKQQEDPRFEQILDDLASKVFAGASLSQAMSLHSCFPSSIVLLVRAGETGGDLVGRLRRAAGLLEKSDELRNKVKSVLIGPTITVIASAIMLVGIVKFVLPQFVGMYDQMEMELPAISQAVFKVISLVNNPLTLLAVVVLGILLLAFRASLRERAFLWGVSLPWTRGVVGSVLCTSACDTLACLHRDGVPLHQALGLMVDSAPFQLHRSRLKEAKKRLIETGSLAEAFRAVEYFPSIFITMLVVGEESGGMEKLLLSCGRYLEDETDLILEQFSAVIEPIVMACLGVCMTFLFVGMFLPIYGLLDKF